MVPAPEPAATAAEALAATGAAATTTTTAEAARQRRRRPWRHQQQHYIATATASVTKRSLFLFWDSEAPLAFGAYHVTGDLSPKALACWWRLSLIVCFLLLRIFEIVIIGIIWLLWLLLSSLVFGCCC